MGAGFWENNYFRIIKTMQMEKAPIDQIFLRRKNIIIHIKKINNLNNNNFKLMSKKNLKNYKVNK